MRKNKSNNCFFGSKNKIFNILTLALMIFPILAQLFVGSMTSVRAENVEANGINGTATGTATYGNLVKNTEGEMPQWYWQLGNVRNSHAADGNEPWSDPNDITHDYLTKLNEAGNDLTSYNIRKFAKETKTKGTYDVFLNVRGNSKNPKPLDIYLVLDNSTSMEEVDSPTNYARMVEGVNNFINNIMEDENLRTRTRVGMVLYSDQGAIRGTGLQYLDKPGVRSGVPVSNIQKDLLLDLIAQNKPMGPQTFTQGGIRFAREAFDWYEAGHDPEHTPAENKVIALLTDGIPNRIYQVASDNGQYNSVLPTRFNSVDDIDIVRDTMVRNPAHRNISMDRYFSISRTAGNSISEKYALYGERWMGADRPLQANRTTGGLSNQLINDSDWQDLKAGPTGKIFPYTAWDASIKEANLAKEKYTMFGLGIGIHALYESGDNVYKDEAHAKSLFKQLSSPGRFGFAEKGTEIRDYLTNLIYQIRDSLKSVEGGRIVDPIGPMYNKIGETDVKFLDHVDYNDSDHVGMNADDINKDKERRKNHILNHISKKNSNDRNIVLDDLILGKDEEIQIHYQVKINPLAAGFQQNIWYPMNGQTKLYPKYAYDLGTDVMHENEFFVPSGKYIKPKIVFKKVWTDFYGKELTADQLAKETIPQRISVVLTRKHENGPSDNFVYKHSVDILKNESWTKTVTDFQAEESDAHGDYVYQIEEPKNLNNLGAFEYDTFEKTFDSNTNTTTFTVYNKKSKPDFEPKINVTKVGVYGDKLEGADFELKESGNQNTNLFLDMDADKAIFNYTGMMLDKSYELKEIKAPTGYIKLENPISIKFVQKDKKLVAQVTAEPFEKSLIKELKDAKPINNSKNTYEIEIKNPEGVSTDKRDALNLTIKNNLDSDLPLTGGNGKQRQIVFALIPLLMLTIGTSFYHFYLKKRN